MQHDLQHFASFSEIFRLLLHSICNVTKNKHMMYLTLSLTSCGITGEPIINASIQELHQ